MVVTTDVNQGYKPIQFEVSRGSIKPSKEPLPQSAVTTSATDNQMQHPSDKENEAPAASSAEPSEVVTQPETAAQSTDSNSSPDSVFSQVDEAVFFCKFL